jgi:Cell division septal protein
MSKRKRKNNYIIHYTIAIILIATVLVTLSLTVFFKAEKLDIIGVDDEEIRTSVSTSANFAIGKNLFRINFDNVRKAVLAECPTLADVKVSRGLPNKIKIECSSANPIFAVPFGEGEIFLLAETGRIIGTGEGILVQYLYGIETVNKTLGDFILSDEQLELIKKVNAEFEANEMFVDIDLSDPSRIKAIYQNRITINLGDLSELSYFVQGSSEIVKTKIDPQIKGAIFAIDGAFHFDPE